MRTVRLVALVAALAMLARPQAVRTVTAYPREFLNVSTQSASITIGPIELNLIGPMPPGLGDGDLRWQPDWDGHTTTAVLPSQYSGRAVSASVSVPITAFTQVNNFSVAFQPRVFLGNTSTFIGLGDWVIVTLASPLAPPAPRLLVGSYYLGYGAAPPGRDQSLHGQKTDVSKVDVDRPPLIDPTANPTLDFSRDGLTEQGGGDAEDTSLFPRTFSIHPVNQNGNKFAYAEFSLASPSLTFHMLKPGSAANGDYDDRTKGIDGRRTDALGEPVRMFTIIGERIITLGSPSTDGKRILFTGPLGGQR